MCGIAGLVGVQGSVASSRVRRALSLLAHRGPDGEGWYTSAEAVLAMRRLAIIDLKGGDQPIYNEDRTVAAICNGELYNYVEESRELRRRGHRLQSASDVNLIPHLYEEAGRDAFKSIRGMFAAAIWDASRRTLVLARDRVGKKPLFYTTVGQGLAFASELPALLALIDTPPDYSRAALADYLRLGFVPHPETIYEGVVALPPGSTLTFNPGGCPDIVRYWIPPTPTPFAGSREEALAALDTRLREAVSLRLRSDVPIGMFLSGGIDSGLVASYARDLGARDLLCFVAETADQALNEGPAARATARHLELPIETISLEIPPLEAISRVPLLYGQPFGDSSAVATYFVAKAASAHRKVVLNGDGGDEIFAGYRRYWAGRSAPWLVPLAAPIRPLLRTAARFVSDHQSRRSGLGFSTRVLRGLGVPREDHRYLIWTLDLLDDAAMKRCFPDLDTPSLIRSQLLETRTELMACSDLKSFMRSDYQLILADDLLSKMDIATMANSLEARSPLLDVPLAEFAWSLPDRWLVSPFRTKPLLRSLAAHSLPDETARAPKRGFEVPVARWLEHDLRDAVEDLLLAPGGRVMGIGNAARIRDFVLGDDGFLGNRVQAVWSLLMLEVFLRHGV